MDEDGLTLKKDDIDLVFGRDPFPFEEKLDQKVGHFIPGQAGSGESPGTFMKVTRGLTLILSFITVLVCFFKADFVNLTVCAMACY